MRKWATSFKSHNIVGMAFVLFIISSTECLGAGSSPNVTEWLYGHVRDEHGSPIGDAEVSLFDGFTVQVVKTDTNGLYRISGAPASVDRYAVIFFIKASYLPKAVNIKVSEATGTEYSMVLKEAEKKDSGFVIGAIYQPIRGGKIKFQSGIYGFGKGRKVWLEGVETRIEKETDPEGHFLFEVPPGRYKISGEGVREKVEVDVMEGQTVIRNLRSGLVLVD